MDLVSDSAGCPVLDLCHNLLIGILRLLGSSPLDIISFSRTCRAAHASASDPALWQQLCCSLSPAFLEPQAWHARSHQQLYLALVHPYRDLLLCNLWHSNLWPCGASSTAILPCMLAETPELAAFAQSDCMVFLACNYAC